MTRRAVFLDRDGVLNEAPTIGGRAGSPTSAADLRLLPGVAEAIGRLRQAGWVLIAVTNQPDIAKGLLPLEVAQTMNEVLRQSLALDAVYLCPHETADGCECRKPRPGMLVEAAAAHGLDLSASWMVGDRWVDVAAGTAAGVRTILVERPYSWRPTSSGAPLAHVRPTAVASDLPAAAGLILAGERSAAGRS